MARILRTRAARDDLKNIARHIAQESQSLDAALRFLDKLQASLPADATQPELGRPRPELADNVRSAALGSYVANLPADS